MPFSSPSSATPAHPSSSSPLAAGEAARREAPGPLACLVASGILWGTGGLAGAVLRTVSGLSPLGVAMVRLLAGGGLIVAFLMARRRPLPRGRAAWTRIIVSGLLSGGFQAAYFSSIALTSVSLATLVTIGGAPVIVQAAELVAGRRRPEWPRLATLAVALAGLGLLVGFPAGRYSETSLLTSTGLAVASGAGFAALTLIGASPVAELDDLAMTGYSSVLGGLALVPLALGITGGITGGIAGGIAFRPTAEAFGLVAGLAVGPTALAYMLYYRGLRSASATTAALITLLEPLTAAILGALVLGDRLGLAGLVGALLLGASVVRAVWLGP
jgi:drug/metabolite transporter, DME family